MVSISSLPFVLQQPLAQKQQASEAAPPKEAEQTEDQRALNALQAAAAGESQSESSPFNQDLSEEEEKVVNDLKQTDQEVRAHEQAHKTAGGAYAGAIQFETVTGPDGREYAVGGEVPIDSAPIANNPEATIRKMDIVLRAALAPAQPSPQDLAVARAAQQARAQAQKEQLSTEETEDTPSSNPALETATAQSGHLSSNPNALSPEQQNNLSTLLQGLEDAQDTLTKARGSIIDAIG